jgi:hypothetical protein
LSEKKPPHLLGGAAVVLYSCEINASLSYRLATVDWSDRSEPRETFYEPFGDKTYYQGPAYDPQVTIETPKIRRGEELHSPCG